MIRRQLAHLFQCKPLATLAVSVSSLILSISCEDDDEADESPPCEDMFAQLRPRSGASPRTADGSGWRGPKGLFPDVTLAHLERESWLSAW